MVKRLANFALAGMVLLLLYAPMVAVGALSFRSSKLGLSGSGLSLKWYTALIHNEQILAAAKNTLIVASLSTLLSTLLGTALALGRRNMRRFTLLPDLLTSLPVIVPDLIMAAALVVAFRCLSTITGLALFAPGLPMVIVAHTTLQLAFVSLIVSARLATLPADLHEAAKDLYGSPWYELTRVTLPLLFPSIAAGALVAFVLSVDDFVLAFFSTGPGTTTLPVYIYSSVKRGLSPELHALSTAMTIVTLVAVLTAVLVGQRRQESVAG